MFSYKTNEIYQPLSSHSTQCIESVHVAISNRHNLHKLHSDKPPSALFSFIPLKSLGSNFLRCVWSNDGNLYMYMCKLILKCERSVLELNTRAKMEARILGPQEVNFLVLQRIRTTQ